MSSALFLKFLFHLLLLLSLLTTMSSSNPMAGVVSATRPMETKSPKFKTLKPKTSRGSRGFNGRDVESCLPKGFHRTSAPSRYINYNTGSSTRCVTEKRVNGP
uniref:Uncharacterized protein n=1 Tax=Rhizophora mucronata TaxID=61149 RepID=A0A2P2NHS6_RHIMU